MKDPEDLEKISKIRIDSIIDFFRKTENSWSRIYLKSKKVIVIYIKYLNANEKLCSVKYASYDASNNNNYIRLMSVLYAKPKSRK